MSTDRNPLLCKQAAPLISPTPLPFLSLSLSLAHSVFFPFCSALSSSTPMQLAPFEHPPVSLFFIGNAYRTQRQTCLYSDRISSRLPPIFVPGHFAAEILSFSAFVSISPACSMNLPHSRLPLPTLKRYNNNNNNNTHIRKKEKAKKNDHEVSYLLLAFWIATVAEGEYHSKAKGRK